MKAILRMNGFALALCALFLCSCAGRSITGSYFLEGTQPVAVSLTLKPDGSFVEHIWGDLCGNNYFAGSYVLSGKRLLLNTAVPSGRDRYPADTILSFREPWIRELVFKVVREGNDFGGAVEGVSLQVNDTLSRTAGADGMIRFPDGVTVRTLRMHISGQKAQVFDLTGRKGDNTFFIILHAAKMTLCPDLLFRNELEVRNGKICFPGQAARFRKVEAAHPSGKNGQ